MYGKVALYKKVLYTQDLMKKDYHSWSNTAKLKKKSL